MAVCSSRAKLRCGRLVADGTQHGPSPLSLQTPNDGRCGRRCRAMAQSTTTTYARWNSLARARSAMGILGVEEAFLGSIHGAKPSVSLATIVARSFHRRSSLEPRSSHTLEAAVALVRAAHRLYVHKRQTAPPFRKTPFVCVKLEEAYFLSAASRSLTCSFTFSRMFFGTPE